MDQHTVGFALQWGGRRGYRGVITEIQPTTAVSGVRRNVFYGFAEVIFRGCKKGTVRTQSRTSQPTEIQQMLHKKNENEKESELLLL